MDIRKEFCSFGNGQCHKGFYNDEDFVESLSHIRYSEFFTKPDNDEFPYDTARQLLQGSCNYFALSLKRLLNYKAYILQGTDSKGFHAFCQIHRDEKWYYIDARGITSSFDEFFDGIATFVHDEYTIKSASEDDLKNWKTDIDFSNEACEFAEAVIKKYREYYTL